MSPVPKEYEVNGKRLTLDELSRRTGISKSTLNARVRSGKRHDALVAPVDRSEASRIAARASHLSYRQSLLFDPDEEAHMSYEDIAVEMGLSVSSVYRIKRRALAKIRRQLATSD